MAMPVLPAAPVTANIFYPILLAGKLLIYAISPHIKRTSHATSKENANFVATKYVILRHDCTMIGKFT
jgi:hypothetical protein